MTGKFWGFNIAIFAGLGLLAYVVGGMGYFMDTVIPYRGVTIDEWMDGYLLAVTFSALVGIIFSALWFRAGLKYDGKSNIKATFYGFWAITFIVSGIISWFFILDTLDSKFLALLIGTLIGPIGYAINAGWNCADAVRYIPFWKN